MSKRKKTVQECIDEINELKEKLAVEELRLPQTFLTDVTPESLQNALAEQRERMSILTDEGNLFDILGGIYSSGRQNLDVFLQGHAGGPLRVKRKDRIVYLHKIAVSIGLTVQPVVLAEQAEADRRKFRGKGLLARFLYCLPKSNIGSRDVRKKTNIPAAVKQAYTQGIKRLLDLKSKIDDTGRPEPEILYLDHAALAAWQKFSQEIESNQGERGKFERIQDFTGKLPGAALRIAGVCHVAEQMGGINDGTLSSLFALSEIADNQRRLIGIDIMAPVLDLCEKLIVHTMAAFDMMGDDPVVNDAKYAFKWLIQNSEKNDQGAYSFRQNVLHSTPRFKNSKLERVMKALDVLIERNIISRQQRDKSTKKPTLFYYVNPSVVNQQSVSA